MERDPEDLDQDRLNFGLERDPRTLDYTGRVGTVALAGDYSDFLAGMAETTHSRDVHDLIQQLRARGRSARRQAGVLLAVLIGVIVFAISVYVGFPYLKDYFSGQAQTLRTQQADALAANATLNGRRQQVRDGLVTALSGLEDSVPLPIDPEATLRGIVTPSDTTWLIRGDRGTLLSYDTATGAVTKPTGDTWDAGTRFDAPTQLSDTTWLVWGNLGTLLSYDIATGAVTKPTGDTWHPITIFSGATQLSDTTWLIRGDRGTLLSYDTATGAVTKPTGATWDASTVFSAPTQLSDTTWLVWGDPGTLLSYDTATGAVTKPTGATWDAATSFSEPTQLSDTTWLVWGTDGTLLSYETATGAVAKPTGDTWDAATRFSAPTQLSDTTWLVWGNRGSLLSYDTATGAVTKPTGDTWDAVTRFSAPTQLSDTTWLVWGDEGTLLSYDTATGAVTEPTGDTWDTATDFRGATQLSDTTWLVWGDEGTLLSYDTATGAVMEFDKGPFGPVVIVAVQRVPNEPAILVGGFPNGDSDLPAEIFRVSVPDLSVTSSDVAAWEAARSGPSSEASGSSAKTVSGAFDTTLTIDPADDSRLLRRTALYAEWAADLDLSGDATAGGAQAADRALLEFFDDRLPDHIQKFDEILALRRALNDIIGQRFQVAANLVQTQKNLEDLPTGLFRLNEQREDFATFMALCRGAHPDRTDVQMPPDGLDSDPDAVTTACTAAWREQLQAESGNWWQTLAAQVPPGILLLFLLATFGALYRYNLRLAGFHHSRADLLELMAMGRDKDAKLTAAEMKALASVSDLLAADKVEFGKANAPADQAVEIVKTIMARKG